MFDQKAVEELISVASQLVAEKELLGPDEFSDALDDYLPKFQTLIENINQDNPLADEALPEETRTGYRDLLERLSIVHQQVTDAATAKKQDVSLQMSDIHKRATGLRSYIDRFPSRINITGKRKY